MQLVTEIKPSKLLHVMPWLTLVIGLALTFVMWKVSYEKELERIGEKFKAEATTYTATIMHRMDAYEQTLRAGVSLFNASEEVTSAEWHGFFSSMQIKQRLPSIQSLGWAAIKPIKILGKQLTNQNQVPLDNTSNKDVIGNSATITYIEPVNIQNRKELDLDMYQDPTCRVAMDRARDTGTAALSGKVTLIQDPAEIQRTGAIMYLPVYQHNAALTTIAERRQALLGFVFASFHVDTLMEGVLGNRQPFIDFHIFDGESVADASALLYDSDGILFYGVEPAYTQRNVVEIAGRKWTLEFTTTPQFMTTVHFYKPNSIAAYGILLSLLLFLFIYGLKRSQQLALDLAVKMTSDLHESETRASIILNTAVNAIVTMGADQRIRTFNPAAETMFGYSATEVLGAKVNILMPEPLRSEHDQYVARHLATGERKIIGFGREVTGLRHDGSTFPLWLAVNSAPLGNEILFVGCIVDISTPKEAENLLITAKEVAEAANQAKSVFLANMSHELRTPLNAVLGYAQILQNDPNIGPNQQLGISTIKRSGEHLLTLINDILDLAKVEAGHLELYQHNIDVDRFFTDVRDIFRFKALEKGLAFYYHPQTALPTHIYGDEKRLRQICLNLLGNAMKFTEHGEVRLESDYRTGELIITVADTGIGISSVMCEQIFKPFVQAGENRYKQQGTGLGLAISRNLVERMGGRITLTSELGKGSCFTVRIPIPIVDIAPSSPLTDTTASVIGYQRTDGLESPLRILVVDDVAENRAVLRGLLEQLGFNITEATDGIHAVAITAYQTFDVIFMDLVMPKLDGLTATQRILERHGTSNRVVIALTASAFEEDRHISQNIGCRDYIVKPIDRATLLHVLQTHLPLEWKYYQAPQPFEPHQDQALSSSQREALLDMVERGAIYELIRYLENLLKAPDYPTQAQTLLVLAKGFKLTDIRHSLEAK